MTTSICAIIPARSGSKGVPGKNLRPLGDVPLLVHSIRAARESKFVSQVILSTNSESMAEVGKAYGAEVPFLRPAELATDEAPVAEAICYTLEQMETKPDYVLLLQPTSPFRTAEDIDEAIKLLFRENATAVVGVVEAEDHPLLCRKLGPGGVLMPFVSNPQNNARRQDLPPAYVPNGAIYLIRTETLLESVSFYPPGALAYVMPRERSMDIDTLLDFGFAEFLMQQRGME